MVSGKEVPFGGLDDYIFYLDLKFPKTAILEIYFDWTFFATENCFNMGMLQYKLPLIVIVAP